MSNTRTRVTATTADVPLDLCLRPTGKAQHELARTTLCVVDYLLTGDLLRLRSKDVADTRKVNPATLWRRLRADGSNYQTILDHVRRHRCTLILVKRWLPGKCVAWEHVCAEVSSFVASSDAEPAMTTVTSSSSSFENQL